MGAPYREFTRIELSFASPAQPFYTMHLTAKQVVDAGV